MTIPEGKSPRDMTTDEIKEHYQKVRKAKIKQIAGSYDLGCSKRWPGHRSNSIIDARWVVTWKIVEVNVGVKCGFTVRGFNDKLQDLDTYAGAISRSGQRFVNAVAVGNPDFILFSLDVGQAFAKSMTFEEFSALTSGDLREVQFDVPKADLECLRQLNGI